MNPPPTLTYPPKETKEKEEEAEERRERVREGMGEEGEAKWEWTYTGKPAHPDNGHLIITGSKSPTQHTITEWPPKETGLMCGRMTIF